MRTDDLIQALVQDLPTRPAAAAKRLWRNLPIAALMMIISWLAVMGVRPDLLSSGLSATIIKVLLGALLAAVGLTGALRLSSPDATLERPLRRLLVVPVFVGLMAGAELFLLGRTGWQSRLWGESFIACLLIIPALSAVPLLAAVVAMRHGATTRPSISGALMGVGAAGIAIIAYGLFCTEDSSLFIGTWYILAGCIAGMLGAIIGSIALRW